MAQIGISITKRVPYRDSTQEFSNVYHYVDEVSAPDAAEAQNLIDEVVAVERQLHTTAVSFVYARLWSSGGSIASNVMIHQVVLTGTGSQTAVASVDPERAVLMQWPAGFDSRGHPVRLKKWYHSLGRLAGVAWSSTNLGQTAGFSDPDRATMAALVGQLTEIGTPDSWRLTAESGREYEGAPFAHKYLEHHQLGDQWRG